MYVYYGQTHSDVASHFCLQSKSCHKIWNGSLSNDVSATCFRIRDAWMTSTHRFVGFGEETLIFHRAVRSLQLLYTLITPCECTRLTFLVSTGASFRTAAVVHPPDAGCCQRARCNSRNVCVCLLIPVTLAFHGVANTNDHTVIG